MKSRLEISVYSLVSDIGKPVKSKSKLFGRVVDIDTSVSVPYNQVIDSLKFIFGRHCIIEFSVIEYEPFKNK